MHFVEAKGILSPRNGMNIYRGCTHGCIYCDSRSRCYQMQHAFEDIEVKRNAPALLERALAAKRKKCMIGTGAMCDPYMHCEEELGLMRQCLQIIERYGYGLAIQTKSVRILRDLDLLCAIGEKSGCIVQMTLTTFDERLCRMLEPNVSTTGERFAALESLREHKIPTVVWLSPILPHINDTWENIEGILDYCIRAGVHGIVCFGMGMTLREGSREYFYAALDRLFPGMKERYRRQYGYAYEIVSSRNDMLMERFFDRCRRNGILCDVEEIFSYLRTYPQDKVYRQLGLSDIM